MAAYAGQRREHKGATGNSAPNNGALTEADIGPAISEARSTGESNQEGSDSQAARGTPSGALLARRDMGSEPIESSLGMDSARCAGWAEKVWGVWGVGSWCGKKGARGPAMLVTGVEPATQATANHSYQAFEAKQPVTRFHW